VARTLAKRQRDLTRLKQSYEKKSGAERQAALTGEKKAKDAELASIQEARAKSVLAAPREGAFQPSRRVGDPVLNGESVGTVVDARKLKVTLGVPARMATRVKEGQPVSVRVDGSRAELRTVILTTSGESAGPGLVRATALLDNPDHALQVGANGLAEIDCGTQPLFSRLFGGG
jgi:multidrug resistance efflux pump